MSSSVFTHSEVEEYVFEHGGKILYFAAQYGTGSIPPSIFEHAPYVSFTYVACLGAAMPPLLQTDGGKCPHCPHGSSAYASSIVVTRL